jgi:hypothetical protein
MDVSGRSPGEHCLATVLLPLHAVEPKAVGAILALFVARCSSDNPELAEDYEN